MNTWIVKILGWSAEEWLRIPVTEPERAFSNDRAECESERHLLLKKWHPDVSKDPKATEVFQQIGLLFKAAIKKLENGTWTLPDQITFTDRYDRKFNMKYRRAHDFELGKMFVGETNLLFAVDSKYDQLYANGVLLMQGFKYASPDMQKEMERFLPKCKTLIQGISHEYVVVGKTTDVVLLRDLFTHHNGKLPAKHVAWIVSSMLNIVCYLDWAELSHNAISMDTFFVSPEHHGGLLLGGWWYATAFGSKLTQVPNRTAELMSSMQRHSRLADRTLDQDLVRATARELLGDPAGTRLRSDPEVPIALADWLLTSASEKPVKDYSIWLNKVLPAAFGKRRFQKLDVTPTDIYDKVS